MEQAEPLPVTTANLAGQWDRTAELDGRNLPLYVNDSLFTFTAVGDTLFRHWYEVRDGSLRFWTGHGIVQTVRVEKLDADSLVLSNLPFTDRTLRFHRGTSP